MTKSEPDVPPEYFFYLQYHVVKQRELELSKVLDGMSLTIPKWRILSTLNRLGRVAMGVVADFCAIDRTTLTRIMDQLVAVGYVERCADPRDRRQTMLDLTESGKAAFDVAVASVVGFNRKALAGVTASELEGLERLLCKVVRNVISDPVWAESILSFDKAEHA